MRVQHLVGEWRGLASVDPHHVDHSRFNVAQNGEQTIQIGRFVQTIMNGLSNDRLIGHLDITDDIFLAGGLRWKHCGQQVVAAHALEIRGHAAAFLRSLELQRSGDVPTPPRREKRRCQERLNQHVFRQLRRYEFEHLFERKAVLRAE